MYCKNIMYIQFTIHTQNICHFTSLEKNELGPGVDIGGVWN